MMALGALVVGLVIGFVLPGLVPTLAGVGPGASCTEVQNEYQELRRVLSMAEDDDIREPASALFELLERRPDCLGDADRELIEGFRTFLDRDGAS